MLFEKIIVPVRGTLAISRWRGALPDMVDNSTWPELQVREDIFKYPSEEPETTAWHLNFADTELFGYYGGPLFAQDEHQVLEHPILGSLREALLDGQGRRPDLVPRTRDWGPTPYLIKGAQRSLSFDTVRGPYGNAFAAAPTERILDSTTFLDPPTFSNILAMVAPPGGYGRYSPDEIRDVLETAHIGFVACKLESGTTRCVVYTGNWGCGAFGGNPVLMSLLQLYAARMAGLDEVVFHMPNSSKSYRQALMLLDQVAPESQLDPNDFLERVHGLDFEWGQSDGN
jgi:hypothetical protein